MPLREGKDALNFSGYRLLCHHATKATVDFPRAIFGWCFLIFCWNLMARCSMVSGVMFCHLDWIGDALTIAIPRHKGDPEG